MVEAGAVPAELRPCRWALLFGAVAAALALCVLAKALPVDLWLRAALRPDPDDIAQLVFHFSVLPRLVTALLSGAALALSGALLQQVLQNPLAEPSTIGISAGAYLALVIATVFAPSLLAGGQGPVALAGAGAAAVVVALLSWRQGMRPLPMVLAGLVVGLYCGAVSGTLALVHRDALLALSMWNSGSLVQNSWQAASYLLPRLAFAAALCTLLIRPLTLVGLGEDSARAAGVAVRRVQLAGVAIAIALCAAVVAAVGVIGFVGLLAPALAGLFGARSFAARLLWAPVFGAILLALTDQAAVLLFTTSEIPTGAATVVLGAPLLIVLAGRLPKSPAAADIAADPVDRGGELFLLMLAGLALSIAVALAFGQGPAGWSLAGWDGLQALLQWRAPRVFAALGAGALLALSGMLIQRMTGNAMASPEILGVGSGAAFGVILLTVMTNGFGRLEQLAAATGGAFLALLALLVLGRRSSYAGEAMLLTGIVLMTLLGAATVLLATSGDPRLAGLPAWLSGSTYRADWVDAILACALAVALAVGFAFVVRWLEILPLGDAAARAIGVDTRRSRFAILLAASLAAAAATLIVGPLSFVGLMAPRIATMLGARRVVPQAVTAVLAGGIIMIAADWLSRNLLFPREIPTGLLAAFVGGPFLFFMLYRQR